MLSADNDALINATTDVSAHHNATYGRRVPRRRCSSATFAMSGTLTCPYHRPVTAPVLVRALERTVAIDAPDSLADARLRQQWSRCLVEGGEPARGHVPYLGKSGENSTEYTVTSGVTLQLIEMRAGELLMLHAAGIADPQTGAVTALIANSGTGKTTAAQRLCANDFGYITDETVAVTASGTVLPFPKPLSVIVDGEEHKHQHGPDELGLLPAPPHPTLRRLVLLSRDSAHEGPPQLRQVDLLDGILQMLPQLSYLTRLPDPLALIVSHVRSCGGIHHLLYRDIQDCVRVLTELAEADPQVEADIEHFPGTGDAAAEGAASASASASQTGRIRRGQYVDAIRIDDEVLLVNDERPIRCTGLGATVWLQAQTPRSMRELLQACIEQHGDHPDAAELVQRTVDELTDAGVLTRS